MHLVAGTTIIQTYFMKYFQANGLEKTWIFLGGYFYKSEQTGWYRSDYVYPCTIDSVYVRVYPCFACSAFIRCVSMHQKHMMKYPSESWGRGGVGG